MAGALIISCGAAAVLAAALTGCLVRWQDRIRIMDVPNARSSHDSPKPRTGGIAIFLSLSFGYMAWKWPLGALLHTAPGEAWVIGGAVAFFGLGLAEDILHLPEWLRLLVQFGLSLTIAAWGPRLLVLGPPGGSWALPPGISIALTAFWYTGFVNLFNFMDGIDGIAAGEAALVGLFMALASGIPGAMLVSAAAAGFLIYNREPSRIFMGDGGSYLLGYLLAVLCVVGSRTAPFMVYVLFLGTFIADTTATLIRRILRGEDWFRAHRSHYYQKLTDLGFSHAQVCGINLGLTTLLGLSGLLYRSSGTTIQWALVILWALGFGALHVAITRWDRSHKPRLEPRSQG